MKLKGKFALVTGGGSGIGREISLRFANEGASVAVNDVKPESIHETIKMMGEHGERALAVQADVSDSGQIKNIFNDILNRFGTLDILVNNAGIGEVSNEGESSRLNSVFETQMREIMAGGPIKTHWEATQSLSDEAWDRMLRVHLYGTFYCTREALKIMEPKGYGRVINMSSIAATVGIAAAPHYSAAKAGILGFTRALAQEVGIRGINVNAIAPGYIETPMTEMLSPAVRRAWMMSTPLKKSGKPKDIAAAALYLASEDGDFVTGQIISPNGGAWFS